MQRAAIAVVLLLAVSARAQTPDRPVDAAMREKVLQYVLQQLEAEYVYPDVAKSLAATFRERLRSGRYDQLDTASAFGNQLTEELRAAAHDEHLGVRYFPMPAAPASASAAPPKTAEEQRRAHLRGLAWENHALQRVERLAGNIGYLRIDAFTDPDAGAETVAAAMNFIANTNALLVDLRQNHGGRPEMVAHVASYFFGAQPVHLTDLHCRVPIEGICTRNDETRAFWTSATVPGRRYTKPVYILTSRRTFSAGEELAYNLQAAKRATIVGERTGGGANPGTMIGFLGDWQLFVPQAHAVSALTKQSWDGTGVAPDVAVPADRALAVAQLAALRKSLPDVTDAWHRQEIEEEIARLEKEAK